jgi:hypothetical protein
MVVTPELRAQILRLYLAEHWRGGTIARQLHLHRDTVRRVLTISSVLRPPSSEPPRLIDPDNMGVPQPSVRRGLCR